MFHGKKKKQQSRKEHRVEEHTRKSRRKCFNYECKTKAVTSIIKLFFH